MQIDEAKSSSVEFHFGGWVTRRIWSHARSWMVLQFSSPSMQDLHMRGQRPEFEFTSPKKPLQCGNFQNVNKTVLLRTRKRHTTPPPTT